MSAEELNFGLADLDVQDDLDVSMDNDTYQDQANPAPPPYGNYNLKAVKLGPKKNKEDEPVFENNDKRFPVLQLTTAEIIEGLGDGVTRRVTLFQDIKTKPFDRYGTPASNLGDITRAYGTDSWQGIPNGLQLLQEAAQLGQSFGAQLDWSIYDGEFVKAALDQLGLANIDRADKSEDQKKLTGAIYNAGRVTGMRFFPYNESNGRFIHVLQRGDVTFKNPVTGANVTIEVPHRTFEARLTVVRYLPKTEVESGRHKIGPINTKPKSLVAA
jgi:hypothetical protein